MNKRRKKGYKSINDLFFFFTSVLLIVSLFICFLSVKNDCLFIENEIYHLKKIKETHASKLKVLNSAVNKLSRQDRVERIAKEKFKLYTPTPESLVVFLGDIDD